MTILAPVYFASIGLKADFAGDFVLSIVLLVFLAACAGKIIGASLGAWLGGIRGRDALAVGFGLNARGAMEIVLASAALDYGLRGMTIGTPRRGSIHDVILRKMISDCGLGDDITIRNYDWADFILDAMMDGEIDGGCGTPPLAILAARQLGAKMILSPSKVWPYNPSYGIVASERFIQDSPHALEEFLRGHEDACNLIRERNDAAARLVHGVAEIIEEDFAREVFLVSPKYCASLPDEYVKSAMAFVPALQEMGYLDRDLTREDVFCTRFIEKVHPGRHHYEARS
jgi:NitT/TauT family transport system substrate-binding protein